MSLFTPTAPVLWLTGLSGAGKTTIAQAVQQELKGRQVISRILDGDELRTGLNKDLGFSLEDRVENIRRTAEVAAMFSRTGIITICALISPLEIMRSMAREIIGSIHFLEIYISTPLSVCAARDPKGLYAKAYQGLIPEFTGISSPYEIPESARLVLDTTVSSLEHSVQEILSLLPAYAENYVN